MRKKVLSLILVGLLTAIAVLVKAAGRVPAPPQILQGSQQLILVTTPSWDAVQGKLQRYQRAGIDKPWVATGKPIMIVVGKNGMAWGAGLQAANLSGPMKKEGDLRAPAGVYKIDSAFGFTDKPGDEMKLEYLVLNDTIYCVDDQKSQYYAQIVDRSQIRNPDWDSGEHMRSVPQYQWGAVVDYNMNNPMRGKGSCIFMHIWKGPDKGTAGCIAMPKRQLLQVLHWLNPDQQPVIALFPQSEYKRFQSAWDLP